MRILIVHYSRSGHTTRLADTLAAALQQQGHTVARETIVPVREWNKWLLPIPLLPLLPFLPLYLFWAPFRRLWHRIHFQPSQAIRPLQHPDVSGFDLVLLGTPKWLYLSFPVARWLHTVRGLAGIRVAPFATFCGPPLKVFEVKMLFDPLETMIKERGGAVTDRLHVSSDYHAFFFFGEMEKLFRWISRRAFHRPLADFTLDGPVGQAEVRQFCARIGDAASASP